MIFRKPYGFLIKHFKLIHLILTGLFIYLTIKVSNMLDYYNNFILGTVGKLDAISYVNDQYMIAVVASIVICVIAYLLLRYKQKPRTLYLVLIGFIMAVAVIINLAYGGLQKIYISVLDVKTLRLYRDLLKILVLFQYVSIGFVLVRGLGFDIKKFNFVKDLHELNLDVSDEEEVELTLGNTNSVQRKFYRRIREFKYYYLENKTFIHVILIVIFILGLSSCYVSEEVINKVYSQGEVFSTSQFSFKVVDTYVTSRDYNNKVIGSEEDTFVIVRMQVSSSLNKEINTGNLVLEANYNSYSLSNYYETRFMDLGTVYQSQSIKGSYTYLFVYKVLKEDIGNGLKLVYAGDKTVNLSPVMLDEAEEAVSYKVGDNLGIPNWVFGGGNFKVNSFEVKSSFSYSYQYEMGGQSFTSQYAISSLKGAVMNLRISSNYNKSLDDYSFLDRYATLKYRVNDAEYTMDSFDDKTPGNYKDGLYLAVDKRVLDADGIWFDIVIRNKHYIYTINSN